MVPSHAFPFSPPLSSNEYCCKCTPRNHAFVICISVAGRCAHRACPPPLSPCHVLQDGNGRITTAVSESPRKPPSMKCWPPPRVRCQVILPQCPGFWGGGWHGHSARPCGRRAGGAGAVGVRRRVRAGGAGGAAAGGGRVRAAARRLRFQQRRCVGQREEVHRGGWVGGSAGGPGFSTAVTP